MPTKRQKKHRKPKRCVHNYMNVHRTQLMVLGCVKCGQEKTWPTVFTYQNRRRKYCIQNNLFSLVAPVMAHSSTQILGTVARQFQVVSNTDGHHLTLVEGLALTDGNDPRTPPTVNERRSTTTITNSSSNTSSWEELIVEPVRKAMSLNHYVRVKYINLLPTQHGRLLQKQQRPCGRRQRKKESNQNYGGVLVDERLVLLEIDMCGPELARAVKNLHDNAQYCLMPQYPLHVALGTVTVTKSLIPDLIAELHRKLVGKELALDWSRLTLLGPPKAENGDILRTPIRDMRENDNTAAVASAYYDTEGEEDEDDDEENEEEEKYNGISNKRFKSDPDEKCQIRLHSDEAMPTTRTTTCDRIPKKCNHKYMNVHRTELMKLGCVKCGKEKTCKVLITYQKRRRKYRIQNDLYSLVAAVTAHSSIQILGTVARQFQVVSNALGHHLTLVEGLALTDGNDPRTPPTMIGSSSWEELIVEPVREAMSLNHYVRVKDINLLPTQHGRFLQKQQRPRGRRRRKKESNQNDDGLLVDERLVLLEIDLCGPELARAVKNLHDNTQYCLMSQYPLHVALGTVTVTKSLIPDLTAELHRELVGKELALNWSRLTLLGPPKAENGGILRTPKRDMGGNNNTAAVATSAYYDTEEEEDEDDDEEKEEEGDYNGISNKRFKSDPDEK